MSEHLKLAKECFHQFKWSQDAQKPTPGNMSWGNGSKCWKCVWGKGLCLPLALCPCCCPHLHALWRHWVLPALSASQAFAPQPLTTCNSEIPFNTFSVRGQVTRGSRGGWGCAYCLVSYKSFARNSEKSPILHDCGGWQIPGWHCTTVLVRMGLGHA